MKRWRRRKYPVPLFGDYLPDWERCPLELRYPRVGRLKWSWLLLAILTAWSVMTLDHALVLVTRGFTFSVDVLHLFAAGDAPACGDPGGDDHLVHGEQVSQFHDLAVASVWSWRGMVRKTLIPGFGSSGVRYRRCTR